MTRSQFQLDYGILEQHARPIHKLADVKHKISRYAFDSFKFNDGSSDNLWKIESMPDGDYLVALYSDETAEMLPNKEAAVKNPWQAVKQANEVHLFYRGSPIHRFTHSEADSIVRFLPNKLASDTQFRQALMKELPSARQTALLKLYPELA